MNLFFGKFHAYHVRSWREFGLFLIFQAILCSWTASADKNVILTPSAISIFDVSTPNRNINRAAINLVLDQVGNRPIRVISINGPSRSGKSFLLSYFIRHLDDLESQGRNVEGGRGINGFEWRGGQEGVTAGINLWSKPYFVKTEDGDEIAVLLLDTQGLFDKKTTYRQNAIIFTMSSLLSSVFMYNQKDVVLENTLQHINCFSNLAHNIANKVNSGKSEGALVLPHNLMFLLRDLDMAEYDHGLHTSQAKPRGSPNNYVLDLLLLKSVNALTQGQQPLSPPVNPGGNSRVREKLLKFYSAISAFVMPHPGSTFLKDTDNRNPSEEFQEQASNLVTSVILMETTTTSKNEFNKVIDNIETVCKNSATFFLKAQRMEEMQSINEHGNALNKARLLYEAHLNSFLSQYPDGAPHTALLMASEVGLEIARREFETLEEYIPELENQFLEERHSTFENVLDSFIVLNERNQEVAEVKAKEMQRQKEAAEAKAIKMQWEKDVFNSKLEALGKILSYGGGAVAAVGALIPGPGTVAAMFGGITALLGAAIQDLRDA